MSPYRSGQKVTSERSDRRGFRGNPFPRPLGVQGDSRLSRIADAQGIYDTAGDSLVCQEMLPQGLLGANFHN